MLVELQTSLVDKSILSRAQLLARNVDQWASVLSQSNRPNGKFSGTANGYLIIKVWMSHIVRYIKKTKQKP